MRETKKSKKKKQRIYARPEDWGEIQFPARLWSSMKGREGDARTRDSESRSHFAPPPPNLRNMAPIPNPLPFFATSFWWDPEVGGRLAPPLGGTLIMEEGPAPALNDAWRIPLYALAPCMGGR